MDNLNDKPDGIPNELPNEETLDKLIHGKLTEKEHQDLERLLEDSATARSQLDAHVGIDSIRLQSDHLRQAPTQRSLKLQAAIDGLQSELKNTTGNIEFRRELGRGGMGVVYEGYDQDLGRRVAVKVLSPHLVEDPVAKKRLLAEAKAIAQIQHENIVAIYSIQQVDGLPALIQQFVPGESLRQRIERGPTMTPDELLLLAVHLAKGLEAAHAVGIIHRDLKPDNILLDADAKIARIADFGLAKWYDSTVQTHEEVIAGTPSFMSPEQSRGEKLDGRSDLFSLGVVLYFAATGKLPFVGDSPYVVLDQIRNAQPKSIAEYRNDLPTWMTEIVAKLIAKKSEQRIASAIELRKLLESQTKPPVRILERVSRRTMMAAGTLSSIAIGAAWWTLRDQGITEPRTPTDELEKPLGPKVDAAIPKDVETLRLFEVSNIATRFSSFVSAIEAAADESTITIHGNGPFLADSIDLGEKRLRIVAADGFLPEFRPAKSSNEGAVQFLRSKADLLLRGIKIDWPIEHPIVVGENFAFRGVLSNLGGRMVVENCQIIRGRTGSCIATDGGELKVLRSRLQGGDTAIVWSTADDSVEVEQSFLQSRSAICMLTVGPPLELKRPPLLKLVHVTIHAEDIFQFIMMRQPKLHVVFDIRDSILDSENCIRLSAGPTYRQEIYDSPSMIRWLRESVRWSELRCIHREKMNYITSRRLKQPLRNYPCEMNNIGTWLKFWKQENAKSIAAVISRKSVGSKLPQSLQEIRNPTGELPIDCGVDIKLIGG